MVSSPVVVVWVVAVSGAVVAMITAVGMVVAVAATGAVGGADCPQAASNSNAASKIVDAFKNNLRFECVI